MHGIPHISHPCSIGAPQPGHSISIPPCKNKNALSPSRDKALGKTLCGTTLGCRDLADTTAHSPPSRADGITLVTRPYLLASSFSRRLQGDFRPPCPSASHQTAALFAGGGSVLVPIHAKTVQFLIHNITFCLFVNRFFPEKGAKDGFSIRIPHVMSNSTLLHMKKERPKSYSS